MPNIQVKLRRGTATEHNTFTGAEGEVTVDTTNDTLRVHDGSTAGGVRLAKLSEVSGGTGTVTSVGSGTGLTGGPITTSGTLSIADNGVTFAKMQDINTAKVIGRTTAGSGDPEEVSILDEDAMTSNSATALATQQSIKAYVDSQSSGLTVFAKGFIDTSNNVSRSTNITSSSYSSSNFTITFTSGAASPHATHIVQVTPRVTSTASLANYTLQYVWNSSTELKVTVSGVSNLDGISLVIFE